MSAFGKLEKKSFEYAEYILNSGHFDKQLYSKDTVMELMATAYIAGYTKTVVDKNKKK